MSDPLAIIGTKERKTKMANRYPYTCQDCGIKMMRSYAKAFGATMLCSQCYAAKIRELVGNFHG